MFLQCDVDVHKQIHCVIYNTNPRHLRKVTNGTHTVPNQQIQSTCRDELHQTSSLTLLILIDRPKPSVDKAFLFCLKLNQVNLFEGKHTGHVLYKHIRRSRAILPKVFLNFEFSIRPNILNCCLPPSQGLVPDSQANQFDVFFFLLSC